MSRIRTRYPSPGRGRASGRRESHIRGERAARVVAVFFDQYAQRLAAQEAVGPSDWFTPSA